MLSNLHVSHVTIVEARLIGEKDVDWYQRILSHLLMLSNLHVSHVTILEARFIGEKDVDWD
jgi:hypothetical protein